MATNVTTGYNTTFGIEGTTPGTYSAVAEVTSVTPPNISRDAVEATHLTSPEQWREFIAGLKDGGEVSIEMNWIPSATDVIVAALDAGKDNYQIVFPNGVKWSFAAICTAFEPSSPLDDRMTASATFKVSGKPTLVAA